MINGNSIDARILKYLMAFYPVTTHQLQKALKLTETRLYLSLKKLQDQKLIQLEPAGPDTYINLLRKDFDFVQVKRQHPTLKNKKGKQSAPQPKPPDKRIYG